MDKETARLRIGGHQASTKRRYALVSKRDVERLRKYRWIFHSGVGYAYRWMVKDGQRKMVYLHREVMGIGEDFGGKKVVDHINGDQLDCRQENLRILPFAGLNRQNIRRRKKQYGSSRFRGVYLHGSRWAAKVVQGGKAHYLGRFYSEVDAALAAEEKRQELLPYAQPDPELQKVLDVDHQLRLPMAIS